MWSALGEVLVNGVAVGLSPVAIGLTIAILMSRQGQVKAAMFTIGWATVVAAAVTFAYQTATIAEVDTEEVAETGANLIQILLGVLFLAIALHAWRTRPRPGEPPEEPKLFARVDGWSPPGALVGGLLAAIVNVKTIPLSLGAGLRLAQQPPGGGSTAVVVAIFVAVASFGCLVPLVATVVVSAERRSAMLEAGRGWIVANLSTITIVVSLLVGTNMISKGLRG